MNGRASAIHPIKTLLRGLVRWWFHFETQGGEVLGTPGPVLLVPNHVSWIDWLFLWIVLDEDWRFVATTTVADVSWFHRKIIYSRHTFPIDPGSPYAVRAMAEFLERGGRLVLFAEGRISTTGTLMKLFDGTGFLIRKTNARVITCYLRGANRVWFVRHGGWREWRPRVSAHFSAVLHAPALEHVSYSVARHRLTQWLRDRMVAQQFDVEQAFGPRNVPAAIAGIAGHIPAKPVLEDLSGTKLTYRRLMIATDVLAGLWPSILMPAAGPGSGTAAGRRIGVLLPNVNAMPVTLLSLWAAGYVPTILNFSSGIATMRDCAQLAGLRVIVTSRAFLDRARLEAGAFAAAGIALVFLEDVRVRATRGAKFGAWLRHSLAPGARFRRGGPAPTDTAVVLFTSGSESAPKGVELTHANLLANIRQALAVMDLRDQDRFFSALPLFHSFGLTAGTLLPLVRGCYTFLYPSPLHYRIVPSLVYDRDCTVLLATNTFLNGYARKGDPYDFRTLRYLIAGAEKVQEPTLRTWATKFGVRILEGYGATECSPVVTVNTWVMSQVGSAGRLLPGIETRLEPVEGVPDGGRLLVRGPNVMKGYLNPEANGRFQALGGWYDTGDIARIDEDGFVHLLGRLKRFAKVSGEMVSLTAIEDALAGAFSVHGPRTEVAILARPDADRGEAITAVTNQPKIQLGDVRSVLRGKGFSNLSLPRELRTVRSIPKLGTGKVDHRQLARELAEPSSE